MRSLLLLGLLAAIHALKYARLALLVGADPFTFDRPGASTLPIRVVASKMAVLDQPPADVATLKVDDLELLLSALQRSFPVIINDPPDTCLSRRFNLNCLPLMTMGRCPVRYQYRDAGWFSLSVPTYDTPRLRMRYSLEAEYGCMSATQPQRKPGEIVAESSGPTWRSLRLQPRPSRTLIYP